jgi:hypothetical protein
MYPCAIRHIVTLRELSVNQKLHYCTLWRTATYGNKNQDPTSVFRTIYAGNCFVTHPIACFQVQQMFSSLWIPFNLSLCFGRCTRTYKYMQRSLLSGMPPVLAIKAQPPYSAASRHATFESVTEATNNWQQTNPS